MLFGEVELEVATPKISPKWDIIEQNWLSDYTLNCLRVGSAPLGISQPNFD